MIDLAERAAGARRVVYCCRKKITISDLFFHLPNLQALAEVYKSCILSTMSDQNAGKLNLLLAELGDTRLISSRWLRAHGYSNSLVARYVSSGWLVSPARGVYMRKGGHLQWEGVVRSLQVGEGVPLHVGGRFALSLQGNEHYLRLGDAGTITLYGPGGHRVGSASCRWSSVSSSWAKGRSICPSCRSHRRCPRRRCPSKDWPGIRLRRAQMPWSALRPSGPCWSCAMAPRAQRWSMRPMR